MIGFLRLPLCCVGDGTIIDGVRLLFYDASIASSSFTFLLLIFFFLPSFSSVLFICHQRLSSFFPLFLCRLHLILDSTFGIRQLLRHVFLAGVVDP